MLQAGCKADVAAYGALAAAWKDAGEPRECEAVLQKMKAEGLRPNTVIFSTVVQAYGRWGDYSGAFTLVQAYGRWGAAPVRLSSPQYCYNC